MMMRIVAAAADVFSATFFWLLLVIALWWTIAFKGQTSLFLLMPLDAPPAIYLGIMPFQVFVVAAFGGKLLHLSLIHI